MSAIVGSRSIVRTCSSTVSPARLAGRLDEERHEREFLQVSRSCTRRRSPCGRKLTPWSATTTTSDVVVDARLLEPVEDPPEREVRVPDLEEVALPRLRGELGVARPPLAHDPGLEPEVGRVDLPVREVLPGMVRQEDVEERQRRALLALDPVDELLHLRVALRVGGRPPAGLGRPLLEADDRAVASEAAPGGGDGGERVG